MLGQGRPVLSLLLTILSGLQVLVSSAAFRLAFLLFVQLLVVVATPSASHARQFATETSRRTPVQTASRTFDGRAPKVGIRVSWGGGNEVQWQGSIRYSGGSISDVRALGLTHDTPGSIYLDRDEVRIDQPSQTSYGGVEFFVRDEPGAIIQAAFRNPDIPDEIVRKTIKLDDILDGTVSEELDSSQNRLTIARAPGDWLPVKFSRDHLVFETNEPFEVTVQPHRLGLTNQPVKCNVTLVPARSSLQPVWTGTLEFELDELGNAEAQTVDISLPEIEGVYDLKFQVEPRNFSQRITYTRPLVRNIQLVALASEPPTHNTNPWQEQAVIDPTISRSGRALQWAQLLQATGMRSGSLYSKRTIADQDGESWVQLEPGGWQAIELRATPGNQPVKLEIEYLAEEDTAMGISVLQPGPDGAIPTYGFDSGVIVPRSFATKAASTPQRVRHEVVFWPSNRQPFLLIANRSKSRPIRFGKVRVLSGPNRLPPRQATSTKPKILTRQFMAFYESPMFPENFGADEILEPAIDQSLDDWVTFYQGADRLIQYLKSAGYSGAMLTVAVDSGAIYPSKHLGATPIFDSGLFFGSGQDPIPKDVLEMLLRMFDREGLTLVPALALSGPLPALEEISRQNQGANLRPVDYQGMTLSYDKTQPAYDPLNPSVQQTVEDIVGELSQRYTSHPAFGGVSLLCRPDTYTQLGGRRWGYDSPTVSRFLDDTGGIQLVSGVNNDWSQIQNLLLGSNRKQWINWRARQMSQWYQRLHTLVAEGRGDRRLFLSAVDIYRHPDVVSSLSPSLHWSNQFEEAMLELGWNPAELQQIPGIVLLKPRRVDENNSIAANKVETQTEQSQKAKDFYQQQSTPGELFAHRAQWAQFQELNGPAASGFQAQPILRLQQLTPSDWQNRKRFIESIRNLDSRLLVDGGWLLTTGQEPSLTELINVFTQLPDQRFEEVVSSDPPMNRGPITVRQTKVNGRWYFYCINDSPWQTQSSLTLSGGNSQSIQSLSGTPLKIGGESGQRQISLTMEPYSIIGGFSEKGGTQIVDFNHSVNQEAVAQLKARLNQLQLRLIQATDVKPMQVLENAEFEANPNEISGWVYDPQRLSELTVSPAGPNNSALQMTSRESSNWIRSNSFEVPATGRLSVSVWMRTDEPKQPALRISVESEGSGFYRFGSIGSLAPNDPSNQVGQDWRQFVVHFDDLPLDEAARLRIGFDMMESGSVWIDRVQLYDRLFDAHDIRALTQRLAAARPLINSHTDYDLCRRMLNGYWLRFLNDYIGQEAPPQATVRLQGELLIEQEPTARTSSIFERFRTILKPRLNRR